MGRSVDTEKFYRDNRIEEKKEWLSRYKYLLIELNDLKEEYERVMSMATRTTAMIVGDKVRGSREDQIQKAVDTLVGLGESVVSTVAELREARDEIIAAITAFPIGLERTILQKRYLLDKTFEEIADETNYDYRWLLRKHLSALEKLQANLPPLKDKADA